MRKAFKRETAVRSSSRVCNNCLQVFSYKNGLSVHIKHSRLCVPRSVISSNKTPLLILHCFRIPTLLTSGIAPSPPAPANCIFTQVLPDQSSDNFDSCGDFIEYANDVYVGGYLKDDLSQSLEDIPSDDEASVTWHNRSFRFTALLKDENLSSLLPVGRFFCPGLTNESSSNNDDSSIITYSSCDDGNVLSHSQALRNDPQTLCTGVPSLGKNSL
jgi:hypothetical protein